jgi:hypothetical protein
MECAWIVPVGQTPAGDCNGREAKPAETPERATTGWPEGVDRYSSQLGMCGELLRLSMRAVESCLRLRKAAL